MNQTAIDLLLKNSTSLSQEYFTRIDVEPERTHVSKNKPQEYNEEIIPIEVDPSLEENYYDDQFYSNYTSSGRNVTMEPDPFIIVYPKKLDGEVQFDVKLFITVVGIITGIFLLLAIICVPFFWHTILHQIEVIKAKLKNLGRERKKVGVEPEKKTEVDSDGQPVCDVIINHSPKSSFYHGWDVDILAQSQNIS